MLRSLLSAFFKIIIAHSTWTVMVNTMDYDTNPIQLAILMKSHILQAPFLAMFSQVLLGRPEVAIRWRYDTTTGESQ